MWDSRKIELDKSLNRTYTVRRFGNVIEVKEYEDTYARKPMTAYEKMRAKRRRQETALKVLEEGQTDRTEEHGRRSASRSMTETRQLALMNFAENSKFFTMTFSSDVPGFDNVEECNRKFKKFIQKLRYRYGKEFKYLAVIEFQDENNRGAVHYHVLFDKNFPLIPVNRRKAEELKEKGVIDKEYPLKANLEELWGFGWVWIERYDEVKDIGKYLIKYMLKSFGDKRLKGKKNYWGSRNLERPDKITDYEEAVKAIQKYELEKKETAFVKSYYSEWVGNVILREYRIDDTLN